MTGMKQAVLHAMDLATGGDLQAAQRILEELDDPAAVRMLDLFRELTLSQMHEGRKHSFLRHEIGNALSIAQANLEGIMDGVLEPTPERYLGMRNALESVRRLLDDWLQPPKPLEENAQTIRIETFNICAMIAAQAAVIHGLAREKNVSIEYAPCVENHPECSEYIGDPQLTGQVLRNVLINAIRYSPPSGRVEIICKRASAEITLVIKDTGPGIADEDARRIFEEGYRGNASASAEGSGLGLSVVSRLLHALGGNARVLSVEGNGATFIIELPASPLPSLT